MDARAAAARLTQSTLVSDVQGKKKKIDGAPPLQGPAGGEVRQMLFILFGRLMHYRERVPRELGAGPAARHNRARETTTISVLNDR